MNRNLQGYYVNTAAAGETVRAFVPKPLPPDPPIAFGAELRDKLDKALLSLGRLDSVSIVLPSTSLFLYMYVRKEAVLSSMIEGTQSSLSDLLLYESGHRPGVPLYDVQKVSRYAAALYHGLERINAGFPLSLRLLREMHQILLAEGRGEMQDPGEFRRSQNWIGGRRPGTAEFVPPPPEFVTECMGKLEMFLHNKPEKTPALIKAALAHVQFETIHPFLDGNGRLGRLMITLLLCSEKILKEPMLYLSLYFKTYRQQYYDLLNTVRVDGCWENWLDFFADAVLYTAEQAVDTAQKLMALATEDGQRINRLKRISGSAHLIHQVMLERPFAASDWIAKKTNLSPATVNSCLQELIQLEIIREITGQKRNRIYSYEKYIQIMSTGT
ncbi:MAG: cell filamentation protein Fic [Spirochaeta sp. LUC14_002_19_P3]|nr:MAG: cell filamentation protein Fic [Spirochaeta sp. LUC14_002_19_P3]